MMAFIAVVRRVDGQFFKMPRCGGIMGAVPTQTRTSNLGTYFTPWPKSLSTFLLYGSTRSFNTMTDTNQQATSNINGYLTMNRKKFTMRNLARNHRNKTPIVMMTAYDATIAAIADRCGIDLLLIGDSIGNVKLGHDSTVKVTMEDLLIATGAVCRGSQHAFVISDLPFGSYLTIDDALKNSSALIKVGCDAVKLEGGERVADVITQLTKSGIPVMAHIGLTPQTYVQQGGYRTQGTSVATAKQLIADAKAVQSAGAFACVLEKVPHELAEIITKELHIPTIGIGAGPATSGQVLVSDDLLGLSAHCPQGPSYKFPSFVKQYANVSSVVQTAFSDYADEVRAGIFPNAALHASSMPAAELALLRLHFPAANDADDARRAREPACDENGEHVSKGQDDEKEKKAEEQYNVLRGGALIGGATVAMIGNAKEAVTHCAEEMKEDTAAGNGASANITVVHTISEMREFTRGQKDAYRTVGLVPTMGKLHAGHMALVDAAVHKCDAVVVSIFVNPSQFGAHEDYSEYPRDLPDDIAKLTRRFPNEKLIIFAPNAGEMFPHDPRALTMTTTMVPNGVKGQSEDAVRPSFFRGVATVCAMLFNIVAPDEVFFGQKDAMQCAVIRNMVRDFHFPSHVNIVPTVREPNGLALSSRNTYLDEAQKEHAAAIFRGVQRTKRDMYINTKPCFMCRPGCGVKSQ
eukprot:GEMP01011627.1.p1 GENE.GEMP01011627.1~~GEMP01011627.1.p1  ORF type:complete len:691 (+),score=209.88 GEMP01011627.1:110-2182(+)